MVKGKTLYILGIILSIFWIFMGFINFFPSELANVILVVAGTLALCMNMYLIFKK